jgi:hypothetical protein
VAGTLDRRPSATRQRREMAWPLRHIVPERRRPGYGSKFVHVGSVTALDIAEALGGPGSQVRPPRHSPARAHSHHRQLRGRAQAPPRCADQGDDARAGRGRFGLTPDGIDERAVFTEMVDTACVVSEALRERKCRSRRNPGRRLDWCAGPTSSSRCPSISLPSRWRSAALPGAGHRAEYAPS